MLEDDLEKYGLDKNQSRELILAQIIAISC